MQGSTQLTSNRVEGLPFSPEGLRWLARHQLLRPVLQAHVLDQALATVELDPELAEEAHKQFSEKHQLVDLESRQRFCSENGLITSDLNVLAERQIRLQKVCDRDFAHKAETRFLDRKTSLDRVVYSLLRLKDQGLARELYLRIADNEADFAELAQCYSQGPERQTRGIVGPVPLEQAHPDLARRLRSNQSGVLLEPFSVEDWWLVVRVETYSPANFDSSTRDSMALELFNQWVQAEAIALAARLLSPLAK
jgi:parvulin-like peptidyl-prolyl isomerase